MKIYNDLNTIEDLGKTAVALGNFDGVHLGHKELIKAAVNAARRSTSQGIPVKSCVFTFSNNPKNLIPGKKEVKNIIYQDEKENLIESLDVDYLVNVPFTEEIMTMPYEKYVKDILVDKLCAKVVVCGFNHRFGYKAEGNTKLLKELGEKYGFTVMEIEPVYVDDEVCSSTLIRNLILAGEVEEASSFLGRNYSIAGEVVVGNRLGKSLGFPTSNIMIDESMVTPPNGVYITYCIYNGVKYPSITNVGVKPTIGEFKKNMETHIFKFDKELYGKEIKIEFVKMMREEAKFSSIDELKMQIKRDCETAKAFHKL